MHVSRTRHTRKVRSAKVSGLHPSPIFIYDSAFDAIATAIDPDDLSETGGVLIGYRSDDGTWVITAAAGPGPKAKRSIDGFAPDTRFNQSLVNREFRRTKGVVSYLGEWHSHPRGPLLPSERDEKTASAVARRQNMPTHILFPIVRLTSRLTTRLYVFSDGCFSRAGSWISTVAEPQLAH